MARVGVSGGGKIETTILNNNKKFFLKSEKQKAKKDFESTDDNCKLSVNSSFPRLY